MLLLLGGWVAVGSDLSQGFRALVGWLPASDPEAGDGSPGLSTGSDSTARGIGSLVMLPPGSGSLPEFQVGETVTLSPTLLDDDGAPIGGAEFEWRSSDPSVATVDDDGLVTMRAAGTAWVVVNARASEARPDAALDSIQVDVAAPLARAPSIIIARPAQGERFARGAPIVLEASATYTDGGSGRVEWTSNRDGFLGSSPTLQLNSLSPGQHRLVATATDAAGAEARTAVTIEVLPPLPGFVRFNLRMWGRVTISGSSHEDSTVTNEIFQVPSGNRPVTLTGPAVAGSPAPVIDTIVPVPSGDTVFVDVIWARGAVATIRERRQ